MEYIQKYWAKLSGFLTLSILITLFLLIDNLTHIEVLLWLHLATLFIHQFEEYVYPGGFKDFFNTYVHKKSKIIQHPLTDNGIILVNVLIAWPAYFLSAIYGLEIIWLALGLAAISILNGIMHTLMFFLHKRYNPGLISGFFLSIPFGIYLLSVLLENPTTETTASGLVVFIIGTALIPFSIYLTYTAKKD